MLIVTFFSFLSFLFLSLVSRSFFSLLVSFSAVEFPPFVTHRYYYYSVTPCPLQCTPLLALRGVYVGNPAVHTRQGPSHFSTDTAYQCHMLTATASRACAHSPYFYLRSANCANSPYTYTCATRERRPDMPQSRVLGSMAELEGAHIA